MEKERLNRSQAGVGWTIWPRVSFTRATSALASLLVIGIGCSALADEAGCPGAKPILPVQAKMERLASRLTKGGPVRILAVGSSSTEGIGASSPAFSYPVQLQADLARIWKGTVLIENAGKGGETIPETVARLEAALLKTDKPDLVIWQVGTNDAVKGGDEGRFSALLRQGIDAAQAAGVEVLLVDQQYFPAIKDLGRYERFVRLVGTAGAVEQVPVFSRYSLMKAWGERSPDVLGSMLSSDGFHMGDRGYDCMAHLIAEGLHSMVAPADTPPQTSVTAAVLP